MHDMHDSVIDYRPRRTVMWHLPNAVPPEWATAAVFLSVLATQLGIPVPAAPMLVLAGTMAGAGAASYPQLLLAAIAGALLADTLWFCAGRFYGRQVINVLVRFSLSIDTTVRVARQAFERFGAPLLAVSKFVPGLGLVSPPLMGTTVIDVRLFLLWDGLGVVLWAAFWLTGGAALQRQVARALQWIFDNGGTAIDALAIAALAVILYRWIRRIRFRRWLAQMPIEPAELDAMLRSDAPPLVFDARPMSIQRKEAHRIPGAIALDLDSPEKLDARVHAALGHVSRVAPSRGAREPRPCVARAHTAERAPASRPARRR
jgi:membrane protein DedA with SNARE-associated domain